MWLVMRFLPFNAFIHKAVSLTFVCVILNHISFSLYYKQNKTRRIRNCKEIFHPLSTPRGKYRRPMAQHTRGMEVNMQHSSRKENKETQRMADN